MRRVPTIAVAICLLAMTGAPGLSCSCFTETSAVKALEKADAVFEGIVISVQLRSRPVPGVANRHTTWNEVRVRVRRTWKGVSEKTVDINTASDVVTCGVDFKVGKQYLVYAYATAVDGRLETDACTRTTTGAAAARDAEAFGPPVNVFETSSPERR
jgi:hypothetical protein